MPGADPALATAPAPANAAADAASQNGVINGGNGGASRRPKKSTQDASTQKTMPPGWRKKQHRVESSKEAGAGIDEADANAAPNWLRLRAAVLSCIGLALVFAMRSELCVMSEIRVQTAPAVVTQNVTPFSDPQRSNNTLYVDETREEVSQNSIDTGVLDTVLHAALLAFSLPAGLLSQWVGQPARLLGAAAAVTCSLNLLTPAASAAASATLASWATCGFRLVQGAAESCLCPAVHAMWGAWSPRSHRSRLMAAALFGIAVGLAAGPPFSAGVVAAGEAGWAANFYLYGGVGCLWAAVWLAMSHRWISEAHDDEEGRDNEDSGGGQKCRRRRHLWPLIRSVLTSGPVAGVCLGSLGRQWSLQLCLAGPLGAGYYARGFGMAPASADPAAEAWPRLIPPLVAMATATLLGGFIADWLRATGRLSTTATRRLMHGLGFLPLTLCLALVAVSKSANLSTVLLTLGLGCSGLGMSGYAVNHLDIAPRLAGCLAGLSGGLGAAGGLLSHWVARRLTPSGALDEWRAVFAIAAAVQGVSTVAFVALCSGELQPWAEANDGEFGQLLEDLPEADAAAAAAAAPGAMKYTMQDHQQLQQQQDGSECGHETAACQSES